MIECIYQENVYISVHKHITGEMWFGVDMSMVHWGVKEIQNTVKALT